MATFRSMKARELRRILGRAPLSYQVARRGRSHGPGGRGATQLIFAFHDNQTIPPGLV